VLNIGTTFNDVRPECSRGRPRARPHRILGGLGAIAIALLWMKFFPALRAIERLE
jgi:hypothetical protein